MKRSDVMVLGLVVVVVVIWDVHLIASQSFSTIKGHIEQQYCEDAGCHNYIHTVGSAAPAAAAAAEEEGERLLCPYPPPGLGPLDALYPGIGSPLTLRDAEDTHNDVMEGHWKPADCVARQKIAVVVPYRDRQDDLIYFLYNIHTYLKRQLVDYTIYLAEQVDGKHFNLGSMRNVGFVEAQLAAGSDDVTSRDGGYDCIIFHDVDKFPEDTRNLYMCTDQPKHLFVQQRSQGYQYNQMPYKHFFGGVVAITPSQFQKANGFSNMFWSWGNEDDNFRDRLLKHSLQPARTPEELGVYREIKRPLRYVSPKRHELMKEAAHYYDTDGLSDLNYKKISHEVEQLYVHLVIDLLAPDPLEGMPM